MDYPPVALRINPFKPQVVIQNETLKRDSAGRLSTLYNHRFGEASDKCRNRRALPNEIV